MKTLQAIKQKFNTSKNESYYIRSIKRTPVHALSSVASDIVVTISKPNCKATLHVDSAIIISFQHLSQIQRAVWGKPRTPPLYVLIPWIVGLSSLN